MGRAGCICFALGVGCHLVDAGCNRRGGAVDKMLRVGSVGTLWARVLPESYVCRTLFKVPGNEVKHDAVVRASHV